ncbi:unnamed protein product [Caenorhabditis brenneri]
MLSSKVVFAIVASIALASAVPGPVNNLPIIGGGNGGGQGGSGGLLGGLLGGILGGDLLGKLLDGVIAGGPLGDLLEDLLNDLFTLIENLLENLQEVLTNLPKVLENLTGILDQDLPLSEEAKAIEELRMQNPVELDTIFFMAQNLAKQQKGNGIAVSQESQNRIRIRP